MCVLVRFARVRVECDPSNTKRFLCFLDEKLRKSILWQGKSEYVTKMDSNLTHHLIDTAGVIHSISVINIH